MSHNVKPKTGISRSRLRTGDGRNKLIRDRVRELLTRVRDGFPDARRELDAVVRQLESIEANIQRHPPKGNTRRSRVFLFRSHLRQIKTTRPPAIPRLANLVKVCTVVAENEWHLIAPTGWQNNTLTELAHLLRPVDASQVEHDHESKGSPRVAPTAKKRHNDGKVENRISSRALLIELVKKLSARLKSSPADRQWLLKTFPLECAVIAAAFNEDAKYQSMLDQLTAEQIGTKLRKLREERGLTQQQLAELACTYSQNISEHERGIRTPQVDTVKAYAAALGVSTQLLLSE